MNCFDDGGGERLFVKVGPHFPGQWDGAIEYLGHALRLLGLRHIHDGDFAANESSLTDIAYDSYDLSRRVIGIDGSDTFPNIKRLADWVLSSKELPGKRSADDDDWRTSHVVMFTECAAAQ